MLRATNHFMGVQQGEILFDTNFDYIFEYLSCSGDHLLPASVDTLHGLMALGSEMGMLDPGEINPGQEHAELNSGIPAIYTYLGQFIDHDITARTDRNSPITDIGNYDGNPGNIYPIAPDVVVNELRNGRRPQLDLDSIFGDGPSFPSEFYNPEKYLYSTEADALYNKSSLRMKLNDSGNQFDLPRTNGKALIADARNDENLIISQLHASFISAFNELMKYYQAINPDGLEREARYSKCRRILRWAYQYIVVNDYLKQVCDASIVNETIENGPYYFLTDRGVYMPLEFSVAAFRFGHSMIRPFYKINDTIGTKEIMDLLGETFHANFFNNGALDASNKLDFSNFIGVNAQTARKIDWRISKGLFDLTKIESSIPAQTMLARLSQRNLIRGYSLSIPTGQAIAHAMGIKPLTKDQIIADLQPGNVNSIQTAKLDTRTPLWFYILKEAVIHNNGERLGAVGSKLVAETLIGLVKSDRNSYFNNKNAVEVLDNGIEIIPGTVVSNIEQLLRFAKVHFS